MENGKVKMGNSGYRCVMKLLRSEVEYDVDFISWKVARCRVLDNDEQRAEAQTDKENGDWLTRKIELAVSEAKRLLSAYVDEYPSRMRTDEPGKEEEFTVVLRMERGWRGDVGRMNRFFYEYVVNYVLGEWFKMVMPDEAAAYAALAKDWLNELVNEARNVVIGPVTFYL